jgi:hypothetical protein
MHEVIYLASTGHHSAYSAAAGLLPACVKMSLARRQYRRLQCK